MSNNLILLLELTKISLFKIIVIRDVCKSDALETLALIIAYLPILTFTLGRSLFDRKGSKLN